MINYKPGLELQTLSCQNIYGEDLLMLSTKCGGHRNVGLGCLKINLQRLVNDCIPTFAVVIYLLS